MQLGAFSISLTVKDLQKSKAFYEGLGFSDLGGSGSDGWVILKNGDTVIGLFQGMFDKNMLTFNPGWDNSAQALTDFNDVREIESHLKKNEITLMSETEPGSSGPGSITFMDPDGNVILIDQHV